MNTIKSLSLKSSQLFISQLASTVILVLLVINNINAQGGDVTPPEISDFSFTPSTIDTSGSSQTVTVTIRATDSGRGVTGVSVRFRSATGNQFLSVFINSQNRVSGDNKDGVYIATAVFPQYSRAGAWNVFEIDASDGANYKFFYSADLIARGFATQLQVISNDEDTTPPQISDFSFTPNTIDTTNGSQNVTVTVRAKDAKAGVREISLHFLRPNDDAVYGFSMDSSNRISGDEKDGVYRRIILFSQNTPSGTYNVSVFPSDSLYNTKYVDSQELAALGFSSQLRVGSSQPDLVSIGGRILSVNGQGVYRAVISLNESNGNVKYAVTNPFGYYRFDSVPVGGTYNLEVKHKSYSFAPQVLFVEKAVSDLNFTGNNLVKN